MRTTRKLCAFLAAVALSLSTAACSGDAGKEDKEKEPKAAENTEKTEDLQRADADLVIWCDNDRAPIIKKYAEAFAKERGLKAAVQVSGDVRQQFETASKVGKGPDVIIGAHDWLGGLVQNGMVKPLSVNADLVNKFSETAIEGVKYEGKVYGLPYAVENIALIRNKALAPEAPKTIDDMLAQGKDLMGKGTADRILIQEVSKSGNAYYTYPYLSGYGGGIFAVNNGQFDASKVIVDSPESKKGAELLAKLGKEGVLSTNISGDNSNALFAEGRTPFFISGPWAVESAKKAGIDYGISPLPAVPGGNAMQPFVGVQMFYVSSHAANPGVAEEFLLETLPNEELQIELYDVGHRAPALKSALDKVSENDKDITAWFEAGKDALPMPNIPAMNAVWGPLGQAEADVISGAAEPGPRFDAAAEEIRKAIDESAK